MIVSVDDDKLEGRTHDVDDIVDEPSGFVALHTVYIGGDTDISWGFFFYRYSVELIVRKNHSQS